MEVVQFSSAQVHEGRWTEEPAAALESAIVNRKSPMGERSYTMEDLAKPVALNHEMVQALDQIRAGAENALYGAGPAQAEELFKKHLASLIQGSGMPVLQVMHYHWFLRELARLWRTRKGRDLAFRLELCIRKWVNLGLEPRTLQFLICEAHERLKGQSLNTKTPIHQESGPDSSATAASSAVVPSGTTQSAGES
jgi:hypothetical protein